MQPEFSPQAGRGEQQPSMQGSGYETPSSFGSRETIPESTFEAPLQTFEQSPERSPMELAPRPSQMPPIPPMQPVVTAPPIQQLVGDSTNNPVTANDDDTIEKEWVDRAKQVIVQTRNDPRAREKAIGALQRDYLMKRYGKKLGATND